MFDKKQYHDTSDDNWPQPPLRCIFNISIIIEVSNFTWRCQLSNKLPDMNKKTNHTVYKLQCNKYIEGVLCWFGWTLRFCTIRRIALIGDWFSSKTREIGQFKFQSPLFYMDNDFFSKKPWCFVPKSILDALEYYWIKKPSFFTVKQLKRSWVNMYVIWLWPVMEFQVLIEILAGNWNWNSGLGYLQRF